MLVGLEFSMYPQGSLKHCTILLALVIMPDDSSWLLWGTDRQRNPVSLPTGLSF